MTDHSEPDKACPDLIQRGSKASGKDRVTLDRFSNICEREDHNEAADYDYCHKYGQRAVGDGNLKQDNWSN